MKNKLINEYGRILFAKEKELNLSHLYPYLNRFNNDIQIDDANNILVKTGVNNKILIVAHLDRVLTKTPMLYTPLGEDDNIYGAYGWDDRAGIIAALELSDESVDMLFTTQEEVGCIGAQEVNPHWIDQYDLIFELDRHGNKDLITECATGKLCSKSFANRIVDLVRSKGLSIAPAHGVYTDVSHLRDINKHAQMFYLSVGYYDEHTEHEYLNIYDFADALEKAKIIIDWAKGQTIEPFHYEKKTKTTYDRGNSAMLYGLNSYHTDYDDFDEDYDNEPDVCPNCKHQLNLADIDTGCCLECGEPLN